MLNKCLLRAAILSSIIASNTIVMATTLKTPEMNSGFKESNNVSIRNQNSYRIIDSQKIPVNKNMGNNNISTYSKNQMNQFGSKRYTNDTNGITPFQPSSIEQMKQEYLQYIISNDIVAVIRELIANRPPKESTDREAYDQFLFGSIYNVLFTNTEKEDLKTFMQFKYAPRLQVLIDKATEGMDRRIAPSLIQEHIRYMLATKGIEAKQGYDMALRQPGNPLIKFNSFIVMSDFKEYLDKNKQIINDTVNVLRTNQKPDDNGKVYEYIYERLFKNESEKQDLNYFMTYYYLPRLKAFVSSINEVLGPKARKRKQHLALDHALYVLATKGEVAKQMYTELKYNYNKELSFPVIAKVENTKKQVGTNAKAPPAASFPVRTGFDNSINNELTSIFQNKQFNNRNAEKYLTNNTKPKTSQPDFRNLLKKN